MLLPSQPGHGAADEVDEAAVPVVLHYAAEREDHHGYRIWNEKCRSSTKVQVFKKSVVVSFFEKRGCTWNEEWKCAIF